MRHCVAAYLVQGHESKPWPSGTWDGCPNEATAFRSLVLGENSPVLVRLMLCPAHVELLDNTEQVYALERVRFGG